MSELRPYQSRTIQAARDAYKTGKRSILIVAPTGAGKTRMGVEIAGGGERKGSKVLWLAHRAELLEQAAAALRKVGVNPGVIAPWAPPSRADVQVASVQTLVARGTLPDADILVLDEAHHHVAEQWGQIARSYEGKLRIGLTATPERQDGVGLDNIFDHLVVAAQPRELIDLGFLVPSRVLGPKVKTRDLSAHPVDAYRTHADGRRAIVFCASVKHAIETSQAFLAAGIPSAHVDGGMSDVLRRRAIDGFASARFRVLTNVNVLTEGFDVPATDCVILARGFCSPGSYIQAVGRGLRISPDTGKRDCVILDLRGASTQHGLPDEDRVYSLSGRAITQDDGLEPIRQCPECGHVFRASLFVDSTCPGCGFVCRRERIDPKVRAAAIAQITASHVDTQRTETLRKYVAIARSKGYKLGWAMCRFKVTYGHWPSEEMKRNAGWYAGCRRAS